jgi:3-isopropylmalate/(R)-2-methylmalate dehydratase small subunit
MQSFTSVTGAAVPLLASNVDTDVIIRMDRLTERADLNRYAFESLRYQADGSIDDKCVLNDTRFAQAPILLAGENFGCGSSREGAVTALMAMGFRCVIARSFGDIFFANCFRNGMLPVMLAPNTIAKLAAQSDAGNFTVDLQSQSITMPSGESVSFSVDRLQRQGLLEGRDEIGLTLTWDVEIVVWQKADRLNRPWVWETAAVKL